MKTLVFEDRVTGRPFIVLMHGDQRVDSRALAAQLGVKRGISLNNSLSLYIMSTLTNACVEFCLATDRLIVAID